MGKRAFNMKEIWKKVNGHAGAYEVSNTGIVKNKITGNVLKPKKDKDGYMFLTLKYGKPEHASIHRLVASAFCEKHCDGEEVNHIDRNKENNSCENLEWCTHKENMQHAFLHGVKKIQEIQTYRNRLKPVMSTNKKTGEIKIYRSIKEAAQSVKISVSSISWAINGRQKTAAGLEWSEISA